MRFIPNVFDFHMNDMDKNIEIKSRYEKDCPHTINTACIKCSTKLQIDSCFELQVG